ncbi:hypothetical protein R84981_001088 [Carnimonas sp. R-84981]|uniref:preprotein translocase subunit SecG n=1 Tax=Carnimonas bestiolae TaxID=3402172 RepID=UPI003EDBB3F0
MQLLILLVHALLAVALVAVVLIQQGKGAEAGAAFGGGASQTVFGSRGSSSFLAKLTGVLVALFFVTALSLGWLAKHSGGQQAASGIPNANMIEQQHRSTAPSLDDHDEDAAASQDSSAKSNGSDGDELTAPSSDQPSAGDADAQPSAADAASSNGEQGSNAQ